MNIIAAFNGNTTSLQEQTKGGEMRALNKRTLEAHSVHPKTERIRFFRLACACNVVLDIL